MRLTAFRPFVLASTSIGREGPDFHSGCHRLIHWNLPGNPVDLEQREARIHRDKKTCCPARVPAAHADHAVALRRVGDDIWKLMLKLADQAARP